MAIAGVAAALAFYAFWTAAADPYGAPSHEQWRVLGVALLVVAFVAWRQRRA
jgi:MYXO-CTERM domain-containing protein